LRRKKILPKSINFILHLKDEEIYEAFLTLFKLLSGLGRADRIHNSASNFNGDHRVKTREKVW